MLVSEAQLKKLIIEICGIDEKKILPDSTFKEGLQMDSLNIADLMATLEEDYGLTVKQEEALKIKTFGQLVEYVTNQS